ncbi:hypothetical protein [uncultured Jatrophihabitans sp.]|uniref:hypothetical protein n=1 Tax=uncultured Jatrophihabitans sp. TaxID=1610747 RepID=UPI0035CB940B
MTDVQPTAEPSDPDDASDDRYPGGEKPLNADEEEPNVEPFAGDDDILSGHIGTD